MEEIPEKELEWFEAKRTEKRFFYSVQEPFVVRGYSRSWTKGIVFIVSSFLLFGVSFSPVWGSPDADRFPNNVLIPIDQLMNGEEEEMSPSSSDSSKQESPVESTEKENQVLPEQQEDINQPSNDEKTKEYVEKKDKNESFDSHLDTKKVDDQPKKETITKNDLNRSPTNKRNDSSNVRTEDGGTLPNTATPFGTLLVRGIAFVLLGLGVRSLSNKEIEEN